jgi:DNA-directed RNA polymerase subunit RPC12/RpoP
LEEDEMGRLTELNVDKMKYPFGRCANCGEEFTSELRNGYEIRHCPNCGTLIDDFLFVTDSIDEKVKQFDIFCDDCGHRIYSATPDGKGGDWIDKVAGVCGDGCGRELCGKCSDWDEDTGLCRDCFEKEGQMKYSFNTPYEELSDTLKTIITADNTIDADVWNAASQKKRIALCKKAFGEWIGKLSEAELDYLEDVNMHTALRVLRGRR